MKATLLSIQNGQGGTYLDLGRKIGASIDSLIEDFDDRFTDEEWASIASWSGIEERYYIKEGVSPTGILQRMFACERHPDGNGDLVRQIPYHQRRNFLSGVIQGIAEDR